MDPGSWLTNEAPFCNSEEIAYCPDPPPKHIPKPHNAESRVPRLKRKRPSNGRGSITEDGVVRAWLVKAALERGGDNIATRHEVLKSAEELSRHYLKYEALGEHMREKRPYDLEDAECQSLPTKRLKCYGCSASTSQLHSSYLFSCNACGDLFERQRYASRPLPNTWAVVTGGRTKLGYQIVLKLLRAGAHCIPTTRQPERAMTQYAAEPDANTWLERLHLFPTPLDLLASDLPGEITKLKHFILEKTNRVDILVNCAAQTIRAFNSPRVTTPGETNKYGDPAKLQAAESSWTLMLNDVSFDEWKEVFAVNAIAPALLVSALMPLLKGDLCDSGLESIPKHAYILNVHAREGIFAVRKSTRHIHTNMAKAALAMLTKCISQRKGMQGQKRSVRVHGIDPGWISTDEYTESACPWVIPPLDEVDGAARILHPLWACLKSDPRTRRHFTSLTY